MYLLIVGPGGNGHLADAAEFAPRRRGTAALPAAAATTAAAALACVALGVVYADPASGGP